MTEDFYNDYFEDLATRLKAIAHNEADHRAFFVIESIDEMREVQENIRKNMVTPALLLEEFEDDLNDFNADNNREILQGAIAVVLRISAKDTPSIRDARKQARAIARKLVFKMKRDSVNGILSENNITSKLESKGFPVGPVADNCYGWRYDFTWSTSLNIADDPADWLS